MSLRSVGWMIALVACSGDKPDPKASLSSSCGGADGLRGSWGHPYAQRACCVVDRPGQPCNLGFAEGPSPKVTADGVTCDPGDESRPTWAADGRLEVCRCNDGVTFASSACLRPEADVVVGCDLGTAPGMEHAMSLFVAGFNHRLLDADQFVDQRGVDQLVEAILQSTPDRESIVIALSGSGAPDGMQCDAGSELGDDGVGQNGECLAQALRRRTGLGFVYTAWHGQTFAKYRAGFAVVSGPRWNPLRGEDGAFGTHVSVGGLEAALEVRLEDARHPTTRVPIYVMHSGVPMEEHVGGVLQYARDHHHAGDLSPLIVGDMNYGFTDGEADTVFLDGAMDWHDARLTCGSQAFHLERDIVHLFGGRAADFPNGAGSLVRSAFKYSRGADGAPTSAKAGILLPEIGHNVVGIDFALPGGSCPSGKTRCGSVCADLSSDVENCGVCGNVCLPDPAQCVQGQCNTDIPTCKPPNRFWCDCAGECVTTPARCNVICQDK